VRVPRVLNKATNFNLTSVDGVVDFARDKETDFAIGV